MKKSIRFSSIFCVIVSIFIIVDSSAQEAVSWLSEYTSDINAGSYTYKYNYSTVDNKACKLKIEELKTDKKANTITKSTIFYLSDLDATKLTYKPSGTSIIVTLATKVSQKFIGAYSPSGLEEFTNSVSIYFDAVDKARSFIDAIKKHIDECKSSDLSWASPEEAFEWLNKNVGESENSGSSVKQTFSKGEKNYLAQFSTETTDSKGISKKSNFFFNLSDINPNEILLEISGKLLRVIVPVKDNKNYIQEKSDDQNISYTKEIIILSEDMEQARNMINALNFLVSSVKPERKIWDNYSEALDYIKNNLKEVAVGSNLIAQELNFTASTSGIVSFKTVETDSKGIQTEQINSFYLADIMSAVKLEVSSKTADLLIETIDKTKYIKQTAKNKTTGYSSSFKIYLDNIDQARDIQNALEYAVKNNTKGILEFTMLPEAVDWVNKNPGDVNIDSKSYHQTIQFDPANENKIDLKVITSDASGISFKESFEFYPEDISVDKLEIKVSGKKLYIVLSTGKLKYIKTYRDDVLQNYSNETEFLFEDIQAARNFIAAINCIHEKSIVSDRSMSSKSDAYSFLVENIKGLDVAGKKAEQKIEQIESNNCKLKYTFTETDSKGISSENNYEFILSDIDCIKSGTEISSKDVKINLFTKDKQTLVKPYKNGEPGNFIYTVEIYVNDVLTAKKIMAAITTLSKECK
jgi:hypothetical protein